ncbi:MAG: transposase [Planctomycetes bacterium]|nr:transposase [Planctomycetota bacterium]
MSNNLSGTLEKLCEPLGVLIKKNSHHRKCRSLTDEDWARGGILRALSLEASGRGHLQHLTLTQESFTHVGHYFASLKSKRRLKFVEELSTQLSRTKNAWDYCDDPFADCSDLDNFDIYSGDGHYHGAPVHEKMVKGKKYGTQHFYGRNMRNHMVFQLDVAEYGGWRKKESDIRMLRRQDIEKLRQAAEVGRKVLWVWDSACMDFMQWFKWKMNSGIYFLTKEKKLNNLQIIGKPPFDSNDPINHGVLKDEMVTGSSCGSQMRRVTYKCPDTEVVYHFVTNLNHTIRPGVIAYLYKCRWNIEKTYNTFKHKFNEKKAWATKPEAEKAQAHFLCLAHNLSLILNRKIQRETPPSNDNSQRQEKGININDKHIKRRKKRQKSLLEKTQKKGRHVGELLLREHRLAELPVVFYRWLREFVKIRASWVDSVEQLWRCCAVF